MNIQLRPPHAAPTMAGMTKRSAWCRISCGVAGVVLPAAFVASHIPCLLAGASLLGIIGASFSSCLGGASSTSSCCAPAAPANGSTPSAHVKVIGMGNAHSCCIPPATMDATTTATMRMR